MKTFEQILSDYHILGKLRQHGLATRVIESAIYWQSLTTPAGNEIEEDQKEPVGDFEKQLEYLEQELFRLYRLEGLANGASKAHSTCFLIRSSITPSAPMKTEEGQTQEQSFTLQDMIDCFSTAWIRRDNHKNRLLRQQEYFKEKFNIDLK